VQNKAINYILFDHWLDGKGFAAFDLPGNRDLFFIICAVDAGNVIILD